MSALFETIRVVGAGRMGRAIVTALRSAGLRVPPPGLRGETAAEADIVILAVPDRAIAEASSRIEPGRVVAHLSGATSLEVLAPHECFSMHPLTTVSGLEAREAAPFDGVFAAISASSPRTLDLAERLARTLGMTPFELAGEDRAAYHAAASIASNFLVTLEWVAEQLALDAGAPREALVPLVSAAVRNWVSLGPEAALTGPVARGDARTVAWQRAALEQRMPERLGLFDALVAATEQLATERDTKRPPGNETAAGAAT